MEDLVWLIPAAPLAGFLFLVLLGRRLGEPAAGWVATLACAGSFGAAIAVFAGLLGESADQRLYINDLFTWIPSGDLQVEMGFQADSLSITMALFVTGVGALIHLYSVGYMHGDPDFSKFFIYLNLFVFSMLMLVLGSSLPVTFLGWEGVGACSYWLISFWFTDEAKASAGKKAFVTNRIGDWGFMVAMFLAFASVGTLSYEGLAHAVEENELAAVTATGIALMLFVGAVGKSAQLPLFVWLPDAMAGPTPVSALIHAATMVTAGVFLMARSNLILDAAYDWAPEIIAWVGVATALFAATIALAQNDIKRVLAFSTVSQLGFMFLAIGTGAYVAAIFHMVTHAFFKALLFLGSGSVIHGMDDEQDMRMMGALRKAMPVTAFTFIIGWLAIAGVPPFAGFWSKDEILLSAWVTNKGMWAVGLIAALLTAYYMSRQVFMVFYGKANWTADAEAGGTEDESTDAAAEAKAQVTEIHPHESPWQMTVPLMVLAGLATVGGLLNLPFTNMHFLQDWLVPGEVAGQDIGPIFEHSELHVDVAGATQVALAVAAAVIALVGIGLAAMVYLTRKVRAVEPGVLAHGWYYDEAVTAVVGGPGRQAFEAVAWFDRNVIDGAVNGVGWLVRGGGRLLRLAQPGFVRSYALGITTGVVIVLGYFITRLAF